MSVFLRWRIILLRFMMHNETGRKERRREKKNELGVCSDNNPDYDKISERMREKDESYIDITAHIYSQLLYESVIRLTKYDMATTYNRQLAELLILLDTCLEA
jgi:hypothetical protein